MYLMVVNLTNMVEISDLTHIYGGENKALDSLSFSIKEGELVALLGPNGAGKSTAVKIITGILKASSGSVKVNGHEVTENLDLIRGLIGFMPQETALYQDLTAQETLEFHADLYNVAKVERATRVSQMLELSGLTHRKDDLVRTYSGGMKRRLALVRSILHDSRLIILDEMSLGVDVHSRNLIWNQVRKLKQEGRTILFCTNYMDEASALADRVLILDHGKLVASGTTEELKQKYVGKYLIEVLIEGMTAEQDAEWMSKKIGMHVEKVSDPLDGGPRSAWIQSDSGHTDLPKIIGSLNELGFTVKEASLREPSLGDVFLAITGSKLRD